MNKILLIVLLSLLNSIYSTPERKLITAYELVYVLPSGDNMSYSRKVFYTHSNCLKLGKLMSGRNKYRCIKREYLK